MKVSCIFLIVLYTENKENVFFLLVGIGCGCNRFWCGLISVWDCVGYVWVLQGMVRNFFVIRKGVCCMKKNFTQFMKNKFASMEMQQKISERIFSSAKFKKKGEDFTSILQPSSTYEMYNPEGNKKIGWIKTPAHPWEAGYGWCNLPGYMALPKIPEDRQPDAVVGMVFDEVDLDEFGLNDLIREAEEEYDVLVDAAEAEESEDSIPLSVSKEEENELVSF